MSQNSVTYTKGTSNIVPTASRFIADTENVGDTTILILPSISDLLNFQIKSGFAVAGTFNFAFSKIGNGKLVFQTGRQDETINGSANLVVDEIGSGIIFITSDLSWGITNFSSANNQSSTSKVNVSMADFNTSNIDSPITVVPPTANSLAIPTHLVINITEVVSDGLPIVLGYGYVGNKTLVGEVNLAGVSVGDRIIVPITTTNYFNTSTDPIGLGFGVFKISGSIAANINISTFDISGN